MAKINKDCLNEALAALKTFSKRELQEYARAVFAKAKEYDPLQGADAMDKAEKEINEEKLKEFFTSATQKAKNIMAFEVNAKAINKGQADMRGLIARREKKGSNWQRRNIRGSIDAEHEKIWDVIFGDLSHEEIEHLTSGKFDEQICDTTDGRKTDDAMNKRIAEKLHDYWEYSRTQLILSGAMTPDEFHPRRFFTQVHDQVRIINGNKSLRKIAVEKATKKYSLKGNKNFWMDGIKKYIDIDETFKKTNASDLKGNINEKMADKIIGRTFDNISTGKSQIFTRSEVANDREAIEKKSKMFYVWKSLRDQYEYNKLFGKGNLFNMLMRDAQATASKIGIAKVWGDNPYSMYNDLRAVQNEVNPKGQFWWRNTDHYFNNVMGLDRTSISPNATNFFANARTVSTMASTVLLGLDSISDIGYIASFAQRMGINYSRAWINQISHIFDTFPTDQRRRIARLMKTQVDSHLGYMGRWGDVNNASSILNKISTKFFKWNQLEGFDRGNKTGIMDMMQVHVGENSNKKLSALSPSLSRWIGKFMDEKEWDLLRKKTQQGLFNTDNATNLTDDEIKAHYEQTEKDIPLSEVRDDLYRKVHSMFVVASENTVLSPSEFERAFLWQGTEEGSLPGLFTRTVTHFKMYALAYIDRVLIKGFQESDGATQKLIWATSMLAGTIPLSIMSTMFHNFAMGLSMPDWDLMNVPEREKFLVSILLPSLSIFSGILDPHKQNQDMVWSLMASPSTNLIVNALAAPVALGLGNTDRGIKDLKNAANHILPIQTFPFVSPFIREALGDEAHLEPGQTHYFGQ
jgi:hypothetical protein